MSEITRGVIGMPYEMAMESELSRRQFHAIARELFAENERLRSDYAALSTFNPDWDRVTAAQDSVREHMELANQLKAECEGLRATADLQKLLPELGDALEELELNGRHSDQGYRKLKDWYRKVALAYKVIQGPMFGAEHGELVSQNTWLRSVVEHYAQQHAPLEPIPDSDGWSTRLPGYDLPSLLKDAERYRFIREDVKRSGYALIPDESDMDARVDAAMSKDGTQ